MSINFLDETENNMASAGKSWRDVIYIGTDIRKDGPYYSCTIQEFKQLANFDYDDGYGSAQISLTLMILFADKSHMTRREYDGAEWWIYTKAMPEIPSDLRKIESFSDSNYYGLGERSEDEW